MDESNNHRDSTGPANAALPKSVLALAEKFASEVNEKEKDNEVVEEVEDYARAFEKLEQADNNEDTSGKQSVRMEEMLSSSVQSHVQAPTVDARSKRLLAEGGSRERESSHTSNEYDLGALSYEAKATKEELEVLSPPPPPSREEGMDDEKAEAGEDGKEIAALPDITSASEKYKEVSPGARKAPSSSSSSQRTGGREKSYATAIQGSRTNTSYFGYARIVQNRSKWGTFENQDASVKKSTFSLFKDRVSSIVTGEKAEERDTRLRLEWYRKALESELGVLQSVKKGLDEHKIQLVTKFEDQKDLLLRNGMAPLIPTFETQAWARVTRTEIVASMTDQALSAFYSRHKRSARVIELFSVEMKRKVGEGPKGGVEDEDVTETQGDGHRKGGGGPNLEAYRNFCIKPSQVLAKEAVFISLSKRLMRIDKVVNNAQNAFSNKSITINTSLDRVAALDAMVREYLPLITEKQIPDLDKDSVSWADFCAWYVTRQGAMFDVESRFGNFVDDLREREGRLFHRWVRYNLRENGSGQNTTDTDNDKGKDKSKGNGATLGSENQNDGSEGYTSPLASPNVAATTGNNYGKSKPPCSKGVIKVNSPRSVLAFVQYYANVVIGPPYGLKDPQHLASLKQLTEALVYKRVSSRLMRYTNETIWARDLHWIYKCRLAKHVDPETFGIPLVYLRGPQAPDKRQEETKSPRSEPIKGEGIDVKKDLAGLCDELTPTHFLERETPIIGQAQAGPGGPNENSTLHCGHYGTPYWRVSKILSMLTSTTNPKELCNLLLLSVNWLMKEAVAISQKSDYLGADTVFPILVLSLVYADIPNIHLILHYLHDYGEISDAGEVGYYITCLEAAVEYIIGLEVDPEAAENVRKGIAEGSLPPHGGLEDLDDVAAFQRLTAGHQRFEINHKGDIADLGEWLRDQQTMEDTISILQKEGWMLQTDVS